MTAKLSIASVLLLSVISCSFLNKEETSNQYTTEQTTNNETYVVQPKYDLPLFKKLDAEFAKQEHRFEIDRCEFKYNDKSFFIGDSMEKIISIFGEPDGGKIKSGDGTVVTFDYRKLKFTIRFSTIEKKVILFWVFISDYKGHKDTPYKIIKFRKAPYQLDMNLNEFIQLSDLEHDKTLGHSSADFYIIDEKDCAQIDDPRIWTSIGSTPAYETIVTGGGHMISTTRGDFDPKVTGIIKNISMYIKQ